jgi:hypothetical protein
MLHYAPCCIVLHVELLPVTSNGMPDLETGGSAALPMKENAASARTSVVTISTLLNLRARAWEKEQVRVRARVLACARVFGGERCGASGVDLKSHSDDRKPMRVRVCMRVRVRVRLAWHVIRVHVPASVERDGADGAETAAAVELMEAAQQVVGHTQ